MPKAASKEKRYHLLLEDLGPRCIYCRRRMLPKTHIEGQLPPLYPTLEHVVPVYYGGDWELTNLVLACYNCNHIRGNASIPVEVIDPFMFELFRSKEIKKHLIYPETGRPERHLITKQQLLKQLNWRRNGART